MRCAFVLKLGPKTQPQLRQFEGWTGELLTFLGERCELARQPGRKAQEEEES
jgi:hypothetical protein